MIAVDNDKVQDKAMEYTSQVAWEAKKIRCWNWEVGKEGDHKPGAKILGNMEVIAKKEG